MPETELRPLTDQERREIDALRRNAMRWFAIEEHRRRATPLFVMDGGKASAETR